MCVTVTDFGNQTSSLHIIVNLSGPGCTRWCWPGTEYGPFPLACSRPGKEPGLRRRRVHDGGHTGRLWAGGSRDFHPMFSIPPPPAQAPTLLCSVRSRPPTRRATRFRTRTRFQLRTHRHGGREHGCDRWRAPGAPVRVSSRCFFAPPSLDAHFLWAMGGFGSFVASRHAVFGFRVAFICRARPRASDTQFSAHVCSSASSWMCSRRAVVLDATAAPTLATELFCVCRFQLPRSAPPRSIFLCRSLTLPPCRSRARSCQRRSPCDSFRTRIAPRISSGGPL